MAERVAWGRLLRLGLGQLRLTPDEFWSLTPAELFLIAGLDGGGAAQMTRSALSELEARFPDGAKAAGGQKDGDGNVRD